MEVTCGSAPCPSPQCCVGYMCAGVTWGTASLTVSPSGGEKAFSIAATHYMSETKHTATERPHSQTYISGFTKASLAKQAASPQSAVTSGTVPTCPSCFCCLPPTVVIAVMALCPSPSLFHVYLPVTPHFVRTSQTSSFTDPELTDGAQVSRNRLPPGIRGAGHYAWLSHGL